MLKRSGHEHGRRKTATAGLADERAHSLSSASTAFFDSIPAWARGARGLNTKSAPKSVSEKLALTLLFYSAFGCLSLAMMRQPVFALSVYLHAMTFAFLGMFVASSAGEILFNKEEADILLHRPIDPKMMLWSKIRVLLEVSLWIAGAFNLVGLFAGLGSPDGSWRFPIAHAISTTLEALFCTGSVVLVYQLCLSWFGRERLEGLMTMAQVAVSVSAVLAGQILPRIMFRYGSALTAKETSWWIALLPPAWFAGFDDAFGGSGALISWVFAALAIAATAVISWLAFDKLARNYEVGLQVLGETVSRRKSKKQGRRWIDWLVTVPPFNWWLRDPVSRASFLLVTAYLVRDRDVKLRVYPSIAPMLVFPFIFLLQKSSGMENFGPAFTGAYLGLIPLIGLTTLQYSQQWQAADIFRAAPMRGPAAVFNGARRAVLCFLTLPVLFIVAAIIWALHGPGSQLLLLLPGLIALPVYSLVPGVISRSIPLSSPPEEAKSANRGAIMFVIMIASFALAGVAMLSWSQGWFWKLLIVEAIIVFTLYITLRLALSNIKWDSAE